MESPRESRRLIIWRLLAWAMLSVGALSVMMIVAAKLPARVKLIGLFSLGMGLVAGWVIGKIAYRRCVHYRRVVFPVATLLTMAALSGMHAESFRLWRQGRIDQFEAEIRRSPTARLFGLERFDDLSDTVGGFEDYLDYRYSALSQSSYSLLQTCARWPRLLLGLEVLLGGLAGGVVAARLVREPFCVTCGSWHEPQRTVLLDPVRGNRCLQVLALEQSAALSNDAHLNVQCTTCRCGGEIPTIQCTLERPGHAPQMLISAQPDRETYSQLCAILDGDGAVK